MRNFFLFASVGTVGFLVDAGILFALISYFGPYLARLCSFFVAVLVTWRLNRLFTFKSQQDGWSEFKRYFASQSIGAGLNYFIYALAIFTFGWMAEFPLLALGLGSIAGLTVNFILAKRFVFKMDLKEDFKPKSNVARGIIAMLFSLLLGGGISPFLGQDANWDIKNYHIHNAWSLLNYRMGIDIFPAGIQSYFNPLLDLPYYMLAVHWLPNHPRLVAILMGLPAGVLLFFVWRCTYEVISAFKVGNGINILTGIAVVIGITGAATISQWGTTFNEIQVAVFVVAGIYVVIANISIDQTNLKWFVVAGVCFGVAAGLKLTAAIYAPGAFISILMLSSKLKWGINRAIGFSIAWWGGFLMFYGWWGYRLYEMSGSPMFPMLNSVFKSPLISLGSGMDNRFKPIGVIETLFYPFHWVSPVSMVVAEPSFSDPRFAIAYSSLLVIAFAHIYHFVSKRLNLVGAFKCEIMPRQASALITWLVVSYVLWQLIFSILRYAVSIEVFSGLIIVMAYLLVARLSAALNYSLLVAFSLLMLSWFCVINTKYPAWGRVGYSKHVFDIDRIVLPDNSLVIFTGSPIAYLAPFISKDNNGVAFIGIVDELLAQRDNPLWAKVNQRINDHFSGIYMVERPDQKSRRNRLSEFGLTVNQEACREYHSNIDQVFTVCGLQKIPK